MLGHRAVPTRREPRFFSGLPRPPRELPSQRLLEPSVEVGAHAWAKPLLGLPAALVQRRVTGWERDPCRKPVLGGRSPAPGCSGPVSSICLPAERTGPAKPPGCTRGAPSAPPFRTGQTAASRRGGHGCGKLCRAPMQAPGRSASWSSRRGARRHAGRGRTVGGGFRIWDHAVVLVHVDGVRAAGPERMLTAGARRVWCSDFDAMSAAVASGGFTAASPLRGGPFLLEAAGVGLGDGAVLAGRNSPLLVQGALPADTVWAVLPLGPDGPVLINGCAAGPNTVAVFGPGALHEAANHRDAGWAFVALRAALADRHLGLPAGRRSSAPARTPCWPATPQLGAGPSGSCGRRRRWRRAIRRCSGSRRSGAPSGRSCSRPRGTCCPAAAVEAGADPVFPVGSAAPGPRRRGPLAGTPRARRIGGRRRGGARRTGRAPGTGHPRKLGTSLGRYLLVRRLTLSARRSAPPGRTAGRRGTSPSPTGSGTSAAWWRTTARRLPRT